MHDAGRDRLLSDLRTRIARLERSPAQPREPLPFGIAALDGHLPGQGLARGAVHEVLEAGPSGEQRASAVLFAAGLATRLSGPVLWCLRRRDLFAPGLSAVGLHPDRILFVETWHEADVLPVLEEGLRQGGLAAVVGEVARFGLTPSRRLQLAAERSGVTALVLRRWRAVVPEAEPTAASTRWRVTPAPSSPLPAPGVGRARWHVELLRCRGAEPRSWLLDACDAQGRLSLPPDLADRPHPQAVGAGPVRRGPAARQAPRDGRPHRLAPGDRLR
ncbi:MAG TPA: damage-inducible mutagenesis protein [Microvirga sp.]|jgi:protein ImuA|nr:damage-inducible mutagenesis protein [Microvirga sp.]